MKEQSLSLPQASKYVKEHGLYKKRELAGAGNKSGKISRIKKAKNGRNSLKIQQMAVLIR